MYVHNILRTNSLLKHVIEGKMGRESEDEDISSYWMPLRKTKGTGNLKEEALECTLENWLWKRPATCHKAGGCEAVGWIKWAEHVVRVRQRIYTCRF